MNLTSTLNLGSFRGILSIIAISSSGIVGCSSSNPGTSTFQLVVEKAPATAGVQRTLVNEKTRSRAALAPGTVDQFDCFVMNVMGPSIPSINSSDPADAWGSYGSAVQSGGTSGYLGVISNLVPVTGGTMTAQVPIGESRYVQILGVKSNVGCGGSNPGTALLQTTTYPQVYEVGRVGNQSSTKDVSLVVRATYNPSSATDIRNPTTTSLTSVSYTSTTLTATVGVAITSLTPTVLGGTAAVYGVSPTLPTGLSLNTTTGVISGTPTATAASASYTITAQNPGASVTTTLTIVVNAADSVVPTVGGGGTVSATPSTTSVALSWTAATDNVTAAAALQYKVVRASTTGAINTVSTADAATTVLDWTTNITSATATGLSGSTAYAFAVLVRDAALNKSLYTPVSTTTLVIDTTAPTAGGGGTVTATPAATSVALSWTAASDNVTAVTGLQYKVVRASTTSAINTVSTADAATTVQDWTANTTSVTASSLTSSTAYAFAVLVRDAALNKTLYTPVSTTTTAADSTAPVSPGSIVSAVGSTTITLSWPRSTDNSTAQSSLQYKVVSNILSTNLPNAATADSVGTVEQDWTTDITSKTITGLTAGSTKAYTVLVRDAALNKAMYNVLTITTRPAGSAEKIVSLSYYPSGESSADLANQNGEMNGAFVGTNYYQFYKGSSGQTYLLKMTNAGAVDMNFGVSGWLKLSTVTGAPTITGSNLYWTWKACNGSLYFLGGNASNGVWTLYAMDFSGSSPAFSNLGASLTAYTSGAATVQSFFCANNTLYMTFDTNSATATVYMARYDTATSTWTTNSYVDPNTIMSPFIDGSGNLKIYYLASTNQFWNLGSTDLAKGTTANINSGNPSMEEAIVNSSSDLTFYARFSNLIKIYSDTADNLVSSLTGGTATPTINYSSTFSGASSITQTRMCKANGRYAVYAQSFSAAKTLFTVLNSDGSRYKAFNGGNEYSFGYTVGNSQYDGNFGRFYLNVACDTTNNLAAFAYRAASTFPVITLVDMAATEPASALPVKRFYVAPQSSVQGVQKQGDITIAGADNLCNTDSNKPNSSTYKALLVDGTNRRACSSANCSSNTGTQENIDWVMQPNTIYVRADGTTQVGTTDAHGIITSFVNAPLASLYNVYTGLNSNWTTSAATCSGWTTNSTGSGAYGNSNGVSGTISAATTTCPNYLSFYCVEQ